jgi:hypothetical protein
METKIQERGFMDGLMLRMRRDSSKQSELEQGLQAAADEKFQGVRLSPLLPRVDAPHAPRQLQAERAGAGA